MKTKYTKLAGILLWAIPALMFLSCSDKEEVPQAGDPSELVIGEKQVEILVGNQTELDIAEGNDAYKAFSLNEEIATVEVSGSKLLIDALEVGRTSVIVSDGGGQYRSLDVVSYQYETISVEQDVVDFRLPLGNTRTKSIDILEGNGGYRASSSDPDIVSVTVSEESLLLTAKKEGKVNIIVTDGLDFATTEIEVEVTETTDPYDESELEAIMEQETLCYVIDGSTLENGSASSWYTMLNTVEDGRNLYGWDYFGFYYLKIYFAGDKAVGKKENASLAYYYSSTNLSADEINFEIIRNDNEKIWAVYSFVGDGKLHYGYFIQRINP